MHGLGCILGDVLIKLSGHTDPQSAQGQKHGRKRRFGATKFCSTAWLSERSIVRMLDCHNARLSEYSIV
jgi:hypothetical protein